MAERLLPWRAGRCHQMAHGEGKRWQLLHHHSHTWQIHARQIQKVTNYHHTLERGLGKANIWKLRHYSSSGTTNATQSESGTRTIQRYTTATSHTEPALRHRPHGKGDQPDNASNITHCHKASRQRPIANSWNPSLKRPTHEWHEFGQAPKHLVLMCCYSMRFRVPFFWPCFNSFFFNLRVFNMFMLCILGYACRNKNANINCFRWY